MTIHCRSAFVAVRSGVGCWTPYDLVIAALRRELEVAERKALDKRGGDGP